MSVVVAAACDGLLEDRRITRHPPNAVSDQAGQVAVDGKIPPDVVQPD